MPPSAGWSESLWIWSGLSLNGLKSGCVWPGKGRKRVATVRQILTHLRKNLSQLEIEFPRWSSRLPYTFAPVDAKISGAVVAQASKSAERRKLWRVRRFGNLRYRPDRKMPTTLRIFSLSFEVGKRRECFLGKTVHLFNRKTSRLKDRPGIGRILEL